MKHIPSLIASTLLFCFTHAADPIETIKSIDYSTTVAARIETELPTIISSEYPTIGTKLESKLIKVKIIIYSDIAKEALTNNGIASSERDKWIQAAKSSDVTLDFDLENDPTPILTVKYIDKIRALFIERYSELRNLEILGRNISDHKVSPLKDFLLTIDKKGANQSVLTIQEAARPES